MTVTLAIVTDIHYSAMPSTMPARRWDLGPVLLERLVHRLNRFIRPDALVVLGDCVDLREDDTPALMQLKAVLDRLDCPVLAIPGNHDPLPDRFYRVFDRPADVVHVGPVRLLPFVDAEEPGYRSTRAPEDLRRLRAARADGFTGPVIALQHVPVVPREVSGLRYACVNGEAVAEAAREGGVNLAISGHCHVATAPIPYDGCDHLGVPALCESPFSYTLVRISDTRIDASVESLAMPQDYGLIDRHCHTELAYCAGDITARRAVDLAQAFGLRGLVFTEHSGHLYYDREGYYRTRKLRGQCVASSDAAAWRVDAYFDLVAGLDATIPYDTGMEIDADLDGGLVLHAPHRDRLDLAVGAVHYLASARGADDATFVEEFKHVTRGLCESGIDVLAHPFRIFRRSGRPIPADLEGWVVGVLATSGVAAEINFHTNEPSDTFVRKCLESGVKLSLGSDAHALYEVGEFYPHLRLLNRVGVTGDPSPVLIERAGLGRSREPGPRR